jgi:hypothetical protein
MTPYETKVLLVSALAVCVLTLIGLWSVRNK